MLRTGNKQSRLLTDIGEVDSSMNSAAIFLMIMLSSLTSLQKTNTVFNLARSIPIILQLVENYAILTKYYSVRR